MSDYSINLWVDIPIGNPNTKEPLYALFSDFSCSKGVKLTLLFVCYWQSFCQCSFLAFFFTGSFDVFLAPLFKLYAPIFTFEKALLNSLFIGFGSVATTQLYHSFSLSFSTTISCSFFVLVSHWWWNWYF